MTHHREAPTVGKPQSRGHATVFERDASQPAARRRSFVASDESVDRYGDIIRANGWQLDNYRKNNVLLFAHQSRSLPVGTVEQIGIEGTRLIAHAEFAPEGMDKTGIADTVWQFVDAGILKAVSVGFMPLANPNPIFDKDGSLTGFEYIAQELLELSVVPVPANPNALQLARELKIPDDLLRELFVDPAPPTVSAAARAAAHRSRLITLSRLGGSGAV
jgi:phage head maturation protease